MARFLFIDPPGWDSGLNVGLMYLASSLASHGHEARIIDFANTPLSEAEFLAQIDQYKPDAIGYSMKTATYFAAVRLAQASRQHKPDLLHLAGGSHVTMFFKQVLEECPCFDLAVRGDAERSIVQIADALAKGGDPARATGVCSRTPAGPVEGANVRDTELDSLPFPDLRAVAGLDLTDVRYPLVTSRGCPYNCSFCSVPIINGRKFRARSPHSIVAELKHAQQMYGIREFVIYDDTFTQDVARAKDVCRELIRERLALTWHCSNGIRADRLDEELCGLMYQAGCRSVMLGIESANPPAFKLVTKGETLDEIRRAIGMLQQAGISVGGFFIIGLPGDSFEGVMRSLQFARDNKIDTALFNVLNPYPGTRVFDQIKQKALYIDDFRKGSHYAKHVKPTFETPDFPAEDMVRAFWTVNVKLRRFFALVPQRYSVPRRFVEQIRLVWRYDRENVASYFQWAWRKARSMASRRLSLLGSPGAQVRGTAN